LCPSCGENEAVFFQSQQRSAETGMVSTPGAFSLCLHSPVNDHSPTLFDRNSTTCAALAVTFSCNDPLRSAIPRIPFHSLSFFSAFCMLRSLVVENVICMSSVFLVMKRISIDTKKIMLFTNDTLSQNETDSCRILHMDRRQRQDLGPLLVSKFLSNNT
jgi:Transcription factor S-II (TFIIS)